MSNDYNPPKTSPPPNPAPSRLLSQEIGEATMNDSDVITDLSNAVLKLNAIVEELQRENEEWEATFELFDNAQSRACDEWRKQDPEGRKLKLPDMKDVTLWLITELAEARAVVTTQAASNASNIKETTFSCGHTTFGACGQCLGRVTNERNELLIINEELRLITETANKQCLKLEEKLLIDRVSLAEQGEDLKEARKALEEIWHLEKGLKHPSDCLAHSTDGDGCDFGKGMIEHQSRHALELLSRELGTPVITENAVISKKEEEK